MTSTSLFASAIVLPASMAASTASSAAVPDDAHSTMSTSGCVATAIRPSRPESMVFRKTARTETLHQFAESRGRGNGRGRWTISGDLHGQQRGVLAGRETNHCRACRIRVDHGERTAPD
jgi:hypothetical protein